MARQRTILLSQVASGSGGPSSSTDVAYFDSNGNLTGDSGLTYTAGGGPLILGGDVKITRDGADIFALKDGATANTLRVYGAVAGSHYIFLTNDGTNSTIGDTGSGTLNFSQAGAARAQISGGNLQPVSDNAVDAGASNRRWSNVFGVLGKFGTNGIVLGAVATTYSSVTTSGYGLPAIYGSGTIAATTNARSAAVATYTVGAADGTFEVSGNVNITTSTTFSFSLDVVYTDESNVSRTLILPVAQLAGTFITGGLITNSTGAGPYEAAVMTIRCKTGTTITIRPSAGGTYTTVVYNASATIKQLA